MTDETTTRTTTTTTTGCHFTIEVEQERWWWNEECFQLFGFEPGEIAPTTGLVRAHTEVADRAKWRDALEFWEHSESTWASVIGLVDAGRRHFEALVVGSVIDRPGGLVHGYLVDMSAPIRERAAAEASRQIQQAAASHATIEQAKGILAAMTGKSVEDSFLLMRRTSMDRNIPVRLLAAGVVEAAARGELAALGLDSPLLGGDGRPIEPEVARVQDRVVLDIEPPMGPGARRRGRPYEVPSLV
ncbi:GAF and ANTAR domain-containing protein [Cellulomonas taurus]|uniref:GAF and ANTAR domain-containing protein n=1 Tax=Cellulomonas taurus TaxID=2729175 RepID=UPI00145F21CE|nr:ANTAR domain-containing protein [Cellulomonas taurus]